MELLVSHVVLSFVFAAGGLCAGWWLNSRWPEKLLIVGSDDADLAKELLASLHRLSVRMAADVGEHHARWVKSIGSWRPNPPTRLPPLRPS